MPTTVVRVLYSNKSRETGMSMREASYCIAAIRQSHAQLLVLTDP